MSLPLTHRLRRLIGSFNPVYPRLIALFTGATALLWFLFRVIPKPSRAAYPCQRAAFPVATTFVIWLIGALGGKLALDGLSRRLQQYRWVVAGLGAATLLGLAGWTISFMKEEAEASPAQIATDFNFIPAKSNDPKGIAKGVYPGRVVWVRDPLATKWGGQWKSSVDQWWLDANTDQQRVDAMLAASLVKLTGTTNDEQAWQSIFQYYNKHARGMDARGYQPGEVVAVKINLNNSTRSAKADNFIDASPQTVLAVVRQLVNSAHVRQQDILVYDARRYIPPYILTKVWSEFHDVRFLQQPKPKDNQPKHPVYGDYSRLESADGNWVEGVAYSNGKYKDARLIPKQIFDATYLVNLALLKAHSYPYNDKDGGDNGQTGVTMTGKNQFGSIKGTPELHPAINTDKEAVKNAYSPIVDLAASPNLGAKTILFLLDGLYCGRKWQSYPQHFPNPPFNNRVEPYENSDWPASLLVSMDGVALDSVGLDILLAQTKNNNDEQGRPRILIRANADDYLFEMAEPDHAPSGTVYMQGGKAVTSLGVHERWDDDATKRYSRNLDPIHGTGIELLYLPLGESIKGEATKGGATNAGVTSAVGQGVPTATPAPALAPESLPGKGLSEHDFFYAGEGKDRLMYLVKDGAVVWSYVDRTGKGEISDAVRLSNGNILFAHQFGVTLITPEKKVLWNYDAPKGSEIHTVQAIGTDHVLFIQNGDPAVLKIVNIQTGETTKEFPLTVSNPKSVHGQFRHARLTPAGTLLVAHMDAGKVSEYDGDGREIWNYSIPGVWGVEPLQNGNVLITSHSDIREVTKKGEIVWKISPKELPEYKFSNLQLAWRLPNGNTVINNWVNSWSATVDTTHAPVQAVEVTPDKKVVWALSSWREPQNLGPATTLQFLDQPGAPENVSFGVIR